MIPKKGFLLKKETKTINKGPKQLDICGFLICYCSPKAMGTKKGIPYSFPFWCPWFPFKAALKGTKEKAS